ncbi:MAG: Hpt domain-containing protein, partial [Nitrospirae bacterium]|nr:Hpt domain-containing protein [Nitrospirota bacterium]
QAIELGDHVQLERAAHSLKGSLSHFYAKSAYNVIIKLEGLGRDKSDMSTAQKLFLDLQREMVRLSEKLIVINKQ